MTDFRCIVSADLFRRAWFAVSVDNYRPALCGVLVEECPEGGAILTATDGRCLLSFRDPRGVVNGAGIVRLNPTMRRSLKVEKGDLFGQKKAGFSERVVMARGGPDALAYIAVSALPHKIDGQDIEPRDGLPELFDRADSRVVSAQFREAIIEATYPDWRKVVPDVLDENAATGAFNSVYLTRLAEALSEGKDRNVRLIPQKSSDTLSSPHLVRGSSASFDGFGILMPLRWDERRVAAPSWINLPKRKAA